MNSLPLAVRPVALRSVTEIHRKLEMVNEAIDHILIEKHTLSDHSATRLTRLTARREALKWVIGQGWLP